MNDKSRNTYQEQTLLGFLVPSVSTAVAYGAIAICLLIVANIKNLLVLLTGDTAVDAVNFQQELFVRPEAVNSLLSAPVLATAIPFILWGAVGAFSYMVVSLGITYFLRLHDDVQLTGYKHPDGYNPSKYWGSVAGHYLLFICILVVDLVYLGRVLAMLLPTSSNLFAHGLSLLPQLNGFGALLGAVVSVVLVIYFGHLLVQITRNAWRTFFA